MNLCKLCNQETLTADEQIEHLAQLMEDSAILQALTIVHGEGGGARRYDELNGRVHLTEQELVNMRKG